MPRFIFVTGGRQVGKSTCSAKCLNSRGGSVVTNPEPVRNSACRWYDEKATLRLRVHTGGPGVGELNGTGGCLDALYQAKKNGRNRVEIAPVPQSRRNSDP